MTQAGPPESRPRSVAAPIVLLVLVGVLELILFLSALASGAGAEDLPVLLLALITVLVGAGPVLFNMVQSAHGRQILITLMAASWMVYIAVPVFTQYFLLRGVAVPGSFRLSSFAPGDVAHAQLVALLGLAMLLFGFYLPLGRLAASVIPKPSREWPASAALVVGLLTLTFGWLVYIPGQLGLLPSRGGAAIMGTITSGSSFGIALLALTWLRHRRREALLLLAIVVPLAMLFNFFTGSKRLVLTPPFMIALAYIVYERRIRVSWLAAGLAALVVLYPLANAYRVVVNPLRGGRFASFVQSPGQALERLSEATQNVDFDSYVAQGLASTGSRLDGLGVLAQIVKDTPERVPFQGGWTLGYIALSYIPRIIWADKPEMTIGIWVSQSYGDPNDPYTHVGPTWIGEFFFNFGYFGVGLGMFVLGFLARIAQERLFFWNATIPALFGAVVVLYVTCRSVQGGVIDPVNGTIFTLWPILIAHYLVGLFSGYQRSGGGSRATGAATGPAADRRVH